MNSETEGKLNNIQCWFVCLVLQIGPGAPLSALLWDSQLLDMGLRVWREKSNAYPTFKKPRQGVTGK